MLYIKTYCGLQKGNQCWLINCMVVDARNNCMQLNLCNNKYNFTLYASIKTSPIQFKNKRAMLCFYVIFK